MIRLAVISLFISSFSTSCVSQQRYAAAVQAMESYRSDSSAWAVQVNSLRESMQLLEEKLNNCQQRQDSAQRGNSFRQTAFYIQEAQDPTMDQVLKKLQNLKSPLIGQMRKSGDRLEIELKTGKIDDGSLQSDHVFRIAEIFQEAGEFEVFAVSQWTDSLNSGMANIGDSAWVGSAGQQRNNRETSDNARLKTDSSATAAVGSEPYPGSGAVAMNTPKKEKTDTDKASPDSRAALISEFNRHGLKIFTGAAGKSSDNSGLRLIIRRKPATTRG